MEKVDKFSPAIDERRHTCAIITNARSAMVPKHRVGLFKLGLVRAVRLSSHPNLQRSTEREQRQPIHSDVLVLAQ